MNPNYVCIAIFGGLLLLGIIGMVGCVMWDMHKRSDLTMRQNRYYPPRVPYDDLGS